MRHIDLREFSGLFKAYTELRAQENRTVSIFSVKGNITTNSRADIGGISARVYRSGSWGFASSPDLSREAITSVIKAASDNAAFLDSREKKGKDGLPGAPVTSENIFKTTKSRLSQKELVEFVREIDNHILKTYPNLSSRIVGLSCLDMEKALLTSDGSYSHSLTPRSIIRVSMTVGKDGQPVDLSSVYGGLGQFEDVFESPNAIYEGLRTHYEHLMKKREGVFAEAGVKTCVLDAELAGILAHEAIGHTTEADLVVGGSVAGPLLNKEAASPLVTLIDFANTALGQTCPVPVYVDDEGTKAEDAVLIEKGILRGYMHNKESAVHFGVAPTGNARAYQFSDEPLIRMRNTAILPGTSKLADMIASVDDGYYLIRPSNGQADSTSEFMFGVTLGYEIKNGKLGRAIRDTTISGVAFDLLKTVTMLSDDMKWSCAGMCGKKQAIPVGMGGPAIKCVVSIGGR
ncbi:MAG: TldD/PmbA family protein [Firmicutes bacterium]|nr:TldD/PmbA family protein [Candidatus Fermentithermobacillaceae bacterium]